MKSVILCWALLAVASGPACAAESMGEAIDPAQAAEIQKEMRQFEQLWAANQPAQCAELYTETALSSGEGVTNVFRGRAQIAALLADLMKEYSSIHFIPYAARAAGSDVAYFFVNLTGTKRADPATSVAAKAIYIWRKTPAGWRIDVDFFALGTAAEL